MRVTITNLQRSIPIPVSKIKAAAAKVRLPGLGEVAFVFVGEARMRRINREYLKHDFVTDVITFGHGEVIICPAAAKRNARAYGSSTQKELVLYAVHGLLHLAGYDDHTPADIKRIRAKEREILGDK